MLRGVFDVKSNHKKLPNRDSDSSTDEEPSEVAVPTNFRCIPKRKVLGEGRLFMIDRDPNAEEENPEKDETEEDDSVEQTTSTDDSVAKVLAKAIVQPGFEQELGRNVGNIGKRAKRRLRKDENEKTAGPNWFNMPATELTEDRKRDLELLMMRGVLDPKSFYKKNDRQVFPKYFQVGTVVDAPEDWYSSRVSKSERKRTMVDEIMSDERLVAKSKQKYDEIKNREKAERKAYFKKSGRGGKKNK